MINTPLLPTNGTHQFMIRKFMNGFSSYGVLSADLNSFDDIQDSEDQIFVVADHFYNDLNGRQNMEFYKSLFSELAIKFEKTTWVFWNYQNIIYDNYSNEEFPFKKQILTTEHYRRINYKNFEKFNDNFTKYINQPNYVELPFASSLHPEEIENILEKRTDVFDCGYCGCNYKPEWLRQVSNKFNSFIHCWDNGFLSEDDRINNAFLGSKICLAFNAEENVENGLPSERVFEGLAYGCIVLTDSDVAVEATNGVAVLVNSYEELEEKINYYLNNDDERIAKQKTGIDFAKNFGTYFHVAKKFLNYGMNFEAN
jgi:hypothetical protein